MLMISSHNTVNKIKIVNSSDQVYNLQQSSSVPGLEKAAGRGNNRYI